MVTESLNAVLGSLGLFLVGMWLMSDGLKLAAGNTLRDLLHSWTYTRVRALGTGFMITGLVQSSSAVTVATIGFANAGLLNLEQAIWVIFGSNVGTTMTGWIVALIGFKVNIEFLALPLIGIGMLIRLTGKKSRRAAMGQALTGFGLFFLGISVLKDGFIGQFSDYTLPGIEDAGLHFMLLYMLLGVLLTTLMQSSSAAMVITLGAAESGVITLSSAAAVVIGANLGTTTTAILSVWGATATAKRVAASHVLFNLITASIAILIITPLLALVAFAQDLMQLSQAPAVTLALFHTAFNILGVIVMWPIADRVVQMLEHRFVSIHEITSRPMYLDDTSLQVPAVAVEALLKELDRVKQMALQKSEHTVSLEIATADTGSADTEALITHIGNYVSKLSQMDLPDAIAGALPDIIQIAQQYNLIEDICNDYAELQDKTQLNDEDLLQQVNEYKHLVVQLLLSIENLEDETNVNQLDEKLRAVEDEYDTLKYRILKGGSEGKLGMVSVDALVQQTGLLRRMCRQWAKAMRRMQAVTDVTLKDKPSEKK